MEYIARHKEKIPQAKKFKDVFEDRKNLLEKLSRENVCVFDAFGTYPSLNYDQESIIHCI